MKSKEQNGKPNEKTPVDWYKIQPVIEVPAKEEKKEEEKKEEVKEEVKENEEKKESKTNSRPGTNNSKKIVKS